MTTIVLCSPYGVVRNLDSDGHLSPNLYVLVTVLYAMASCANPFLYGAMNANIRAIVRHTLHVDHVLKALGFAVRDANARDERRNGTGGSGNVAAFEPPRNPPGTPVMTLTTPMSPLSPSPLSIHRSGGRKRNGNKNNSPSMAGTRRSASLVAGTLMPRKISNTTIQQQQQQQQQQTVQSDVSMPARDGTEGGGGDDGEGTLALQQRRASALLVFSPATANRSRCCASPVMRRLSRDMSAAKPFSSPIAVLQGASGGAHSGQMSAGLEFSSGKGLNSRQDGVNCSPARTNRYARGATAIMCVRLT